MPANVRLNWARIIPWLLQFKSRYFKGRHHLINPKFRHLPASRLRFSIFTIGHKIHEILAIFQSLVNFIDTSKSTSFFLLISSFPSSKEYLTNTYRSTFRSSICGFNQVVTVLRTDWLADFTYSLIKSSRFKWINHIKCSKIT